MELALFVYLAGIIGNMKCLLFFCAFAGFALTGIFFINSCSQYASNKVNYCKLSKISLITCSIAAFLSTIIPSEKTMYMMAGGYATQQVVTSTVAKKTISLIEGKLDEELEKISKKVK